MPPMIEKRGDKTVAVACPDCGAAIPDHESLADHIRMDHNE